MAAENRGLGTPSCTGWWYRQPGAPVAPTRAGDRNRDEWLLPIALLSGISLTYLKRLASKLTNAGCDALVSISLQSEEFNFRVTSVVDEMMPPNPDDATGHSTTDKALLSLRIRKPKAEPPEL